MNDTLNLWALQNKAIPIIGFSSDSLNNKSLTKSYIDTLDLTNWEIILSIHNPLFKFNNFTNKSVYLNDTISLTALQHNDFMARTTPIDHKPVDFLLLLSILLIGFVAYIKSSFTKYYKQFINSIIHYSESQRLYNDQNVRIDILFGWLNFIFILVFTLLIFLSFIDLNIFPQFANTTKFFIALIFSNALLLFRYFIIKATGLILQQKEVFNEFLFQYFLHYKFFALLILPLIITIILLNRTISAYVIFIIFILFIIFHLLIFLRGTKIIFKKGILFLYWIIYLCTAEIFPFLLFYKYLSNNT